jgi:predicted ATPase
VANLVGNSPALCILATSREALGVTGEVIWHVPSLSLPDLKQLRMIKQLSHYEAVQLFIERAMLVQPHFQVTNDNAPAVAQICFRLDGIPLAIELAAARVRALDVEQIAKRLDDRFRLLTGGSRTALERHQTLRAAIDWSYNLLSEDEKVLFDRLSIFAGSWTLEAAEQVCDEKGSDLNLLDLLTHLVDKSLVIMDGSRYRMLETTRQYAREKLFDSEEVKMLRNQHFAYFLDLAEQGNRAIHGPDEVKWRDRLEPDNDNFRAALEWCVSEENTEDALRLLGARAPIRDQRASIGRLQFSEVRSWFDKIRALPKVTAYPAPYGKLLNWMGEAYWLRGEYSYAKSLLEEAQAIWLKLGVDGEVGLAGAWALLGQIALNSEAAIKTAHSLFEQSFELYQKYGDEYGMGQVLFHWGNKALLEEHYVEAEEYLRQSLTKWKRIGANYAEPIIFNSLGELARLQGDYERAGKFYEQVVNIARELRARAGLSGAVFNLAWVSLHTGNYRTAKVRFEESLELSREDEDKIGVIGCLAGFASIRGMSGKPEEAARLFGAFECLLESSGSRMDPSDQKEIDHYMTVVRGQLDDATFAKAKTEGRAMTLEQAVAFALEETNG